MLAVGSPMRFWKRSDWPGRVRFSVVVVPLRWVVSGSAVVPWESAARRISRSSSISSPRRRELSRRMAVFAAAGPVRDSTRTRGFWGRAAIPARAAAQRSSSGCQLEDWRSEASQISERPVVVSKNSAAFARRAGRSAAVSVGEVAASWARVSGEGIS